MPRPLRVLLDAHMLGAREGGNETYARGLAEGLAALAAPDLEVTVLVPPGLEDPLPASVRTASLPRSGNAARVFRHLPALARRLGADVVNATYNASPWLPSALVLAVHDVLFRRFPDAFSPRDRLLLATLLPLSMRRAEVIVTLSEASRRDIEACYPFTRGKLLVAPAAPGPVVRAVPDEAAAERWAEGRPFLLAVGTVQPRKNLPRLVEAYLRLRQAGRTEARLVIAGRPMWRSGAIQAAAAGSPHAADVVYTGFVDDASLAGLFRRCAAFAYPSLGEGFGLPVVEAMACGAPVVTSDRSSLPEVAGDAALLVDPESVEAIAEGLARLLADPALAAELRERGRRQAARFAWERTAATVADAYRRAAEARRRRAAGRRGRASRTG